MLFNQACHFYPIVPLFFPNLVEQSLELLTTSSLLVALVSTAILPALLEELALRGIFLSGYKPLGIWKSIFYTALLFGLLHMNPQQAPYAFFAGLFFCFLVQRMGSIWASIIPHFLINGSTVFLAFSPTPQPTIETIALSTKTLLLYSGGLALLSLPALFLLVFFVFKFNPAPPKYALCVSDRPKFFTWEIGIVIGMFIFLGVLPFLGYFMV